MKRVIITAAKADISKMNVDERKDLANTTDDLKVLAKLANDSEIWVRNKVAKNPNCPESILRKLAQDDNEYVRTGVSDNPNCPESILLKLAHDKFWMVQVGVARNINTPKSTVEELARIGDFLVRPAAEKRLKLEKKGVSNKKSSSKKSKYNDFDTFYQACWDKLLEDWHKENPDGEVDQNTQGSMGTTELYADGFGSGEYFQIYEGDAIANCEDIYESGDHSLEAGVEAIMEAGSWREIGDYDE